MVIHRMGLIALILVSLVEEQLLNCGSFPQAEVKSLHSYQDFRNKFRECAPESIKSNIANESLAKNRLLNTLKSIKRLRTLNKLVKNIISLHHLPELLASNSHIYILQNDRNSYSSEEIAQFHILRDDIQTVLSDSNMQAFMLKEKKKKQEDNVLQTIYKTGQASLLQVAVNLALQKPFEYEETLYAFSCTLPFIIDRLEPTSITYSEDFNILYRLKNRVKTKLKEVEQTNKYLKEIELQEKIKTAKKTCLSELVSVAKNNSWIKNTIVKTPPTVSLSGTIINHEKEVEVEVELKNLGDKEEEQKKSYYELGFQAFSEGSAENEKLFSPGAFSAPIMESEREYSDSHKEEVVFTGSESTYTATEPESDLESDEGNEESLEVIPSDSENSTQPLSASAPLPGPAQLSEGTRSASTPETFKPTPSKSGSWFPFSWSSK